MTAFTLPHTSRQWPGTCPPPYPQRLVTYVQFRATQYSRRWPSAAWYDVVRVNLVMPTKNRRSWYLDFQQPHTTVSAFTCLVMVPDLSHIARMYETDDAPAFDWGDAE